jgi:protein-disulfide isomerase
VAALVVIGTVLSVSLGTGGPKVTKVSGGDAVQELLGGIEQNGAYLGSPNADVTITVFNDLQAPIGAKYELSTVDNLIEDYARTGDAQLEFKHFSFTEAETQKAAYAAVAAGDQDREWQYIELFFRNQDRAPHGMVTDEFLRNIANADTELDADKWQSDLDSDSVAATVESDAKVALDLRLPAAPAVVVEGPGGTKQLVDTPSLEDIQAAVAAVR